MEKNKFEIGGILVGLNFVLKNFIGLGVLPRKTVVFFSLTVQQYNCNEKTINLK